RGLLRHARTAVSGAGRARHELLRPAGAVDGSGARHGSVQRALSGARAAERGAQVLRLQHQAHTRRLPTERAGAARNPLDSSIRESKNRIFWAAVDRGPGQGVRVRSSAGRNASAAPRKSFFALTSALAVVGWARAAETPPRYAEPARLAAQSLLIAVATAGPRLVAVGDRGIIVLSDDRGRSWTQAPDVPTQALLPGVCFQDAGRGGRRLSPQPHRVRRRFAAVYRRRGRAPVPLRRRRRELA